MALRGAAVSASWVHGSHGDLTSSDPCVMGHTMRATNMQLTGFAHGSTGAYECNVGLALESGLGLMQPGEKSLPSPLS